jgi:hypothetical protein
LSRVADQLQEDISVVETVVAAMTTMGQRPIVR